MVMGFGSWLCDFWYVLRRWNLGLEKGGYLWISDCYTLHNYHVSYFLPLVIRSWPAPFPKQVEHLITQYVPWEKIGGFIGGMAQKYRIHFCPHRPLPMLLGPT